MNNLRELVVLTRRIHKFEKSFVRHFDRNRYDNSVIAQMKSYTRSFITQLVSENLLPPETLNELTIEPCLNAYVFDVEKIYLENKYSGGLLVHFILSSYNRGFISPILRALYDAE